MKTNQKCILRLFSEQDGKYYSIDHLPKPLPDRDVLAKVKLELIFGGFQTRYLPPQ